MPVPPGVQDAAWQAHTAVPWLHLGVREEAELVPHFAVNPASKVSWTQGWNAWWVVMDCVTVPAYIEWLSGLSTGEVNTHASLLQLCLERLDT